MKNRVIFVAPFVAPLVALLLAGCGGGGGEDAPSSTGSDAQIRLTVTPESATSWVKAAGQYSTAMTLYTRYFELFAPVASDSQNITTKDTGVAPCTYVSYDRNCSGVLRVETEFPVNTDQATFRENSKMTFEWDNITGAEWGQGVSLNSLDTLTFLTEFASKPPFNGKFSSDFRETTPNQISGFVGFEMTNLAITVDPNLRLGLLNGNVKLNSHPQQFAANDETFTFTDWSSFIHAQLAGAKSTIESKLVLNRFPTDLSRTGIVDISVISSVVGRTEYRVVVTIAGTSESVTRTVIVTTDDQGKLVYTAS